MLCRKNYSNSIYYNINNKNIYEQEILIYSIKEDKYIYYGIYDINYKYVNKKSLIKLVDQKIEMFKIIILNYGLDLFFIGKTLNNDIIYFYLNNFRNGKSPNILEISGENYNNLEIINNEITVCIKSKQKLILVTKNKKKEINLKDEISEINIKDNMFNHNMNYNIMNNNMNFNMNNNLFNMNNMNNMNNMFNNMNNMNNNMFNNMNNMNNNMFNNMNNMNNNMFNNMNNMNNNMFNNMNNMNNNMFNNMNNMNNFIFNNMNNMLNLFSENFKSFEKGVKTYFRDILNLNNNYFLLTSTKHIKNISGFIINYYFISIFNYNTLEEITKIEAYIVRGMKFVNDFKIKIDKRNKDLLNLKVNYNMLERYFNFIFESGELIELEQ